MKNLVIQLIILCIQVLLFILGYYHNIDVNVRLTNAIGVGMSISFVIVALFMVIKE